MITPGADLQVYIATRPVDFRKGHDGLATLVQQMFGLDPFSGAAFVFLTCSRYFGPRESLEIVPSAGGSNATIAFFGRANRGDPA